MRRVLSVLFVVVLTGSLLGSPAGAAPPSATAPPDGIGPWDVGLATVEVVDADRGDRTLPVDVWYPVDAEDAVGDPAELDLFVTTLALDHALADPEPSSSQFPVVVFSHGSGGFRAQSWTLMETLASNGFVVVAPDHVGNTALDEFFGTRDPGDVIAFNRPRDISLVIDEVVGWADDPTSRYGGIIDPDHIGVAGHSFGGFTALAVAGGFDDYQADERVDAIMPIAAAAGGLSDDELSSITVPAFFLSGTDDVTVPLASSVRAWDLISSREGYRADIIAGGHNSFTNVCDLVDVLIDAGLPPALLASLIASAEEGCSPELIDIDEAQRLQTLYATSFFRSTLGPDARYQKFLTPNYAERADLEVDWFATRGTPR